ISNCVGARNYRVFVIFVFCCAVYSLTIVTSATSALLRDIRDGGESVSFSSFWAATRRSPQLAGLFLYSLCCCVPMINLFLFNIYLILNNITTNEEVLQLFPDRNPYSAGWRENLRMFLFQPVEPR
ncbi:dhhc zinc finger domain-containing protein, partial [Cystoisospora suis]